jgi:hypothetical protein
LFIGGVKATEALKIPAVAVSPVGGPGTTTVGSGVTEFDGAEGGESPLPLIAMAVKVTATPLTRPETVIGLVTPVADCPVDAVTMNSVTASPPLAPGVKAITANESPALATRLVGGEGTVDGVTEFEATE